MINADNKVHLLKQLDVTDLSGEKVMIDFETGKYFLLKGSANEIWNIIQEDVTVNEIVNKLLNIYEVDQATCEASVVKFLEHISEYGFIAIE